MVRSVDVVSVEVDVIPAAWISSATDNDREIATPMSPSAALTVIVPVDVIPLMLRSVPVMIAVEVSPAVTRAFA